MSKQPSFSKRLLAWYDQHGRHELPWQHPRSAYRVWIAEIMLQQTQVATVIPYFEKFIRRFPNLPNLARADQDEVLSLWSGLGYYARARNLHQAARIALKEHDGELPQDYDALLALPGIGPSTAGAILAQAHGRRHAILDGNVKRVLARYHGVPGWPGEARIAKRLWAFAEQHTPRQRVADYTQAIMDLGATVCTRRSPNCDACPLARDCRALAENAVECYPYPRPRKHRPLRRTRMLVLRNPKGDILLQKRPPAGIWGGLWSLPEADIDSDVRKACKKLGLKAQDHEAMDTLHHGFTHFELEIEPVLVSVQKSADRIMDSGRWLWYNSGHATNPALPAPVSRLLQQLDPETSKVAT